MAEKELLVIVKAKDLGNYIFTVTDKSPKKFRFTLVSRMQNLSLDIIENLYRANQVFVRNRDDTRRIEKRREYQREAYTAIKMLNYIAWMAREQQCILPKQFSQIAKQSTEVTQLLVAWTKADMKKLEQ